MASRTIAMSFNVLAEFVRATQNRHSRRKSSLADTSIFFPGVEPCWKKLSTGTHKSLLNSNRIPALIRLEAVSYF